jgi:hypothetical protein
MANRAAYLIAQGWIAGELLGETAQCDWSTASLCQPGDDAWRCEKPVHGTRMTLGF